MRACGRQRVPWRWSGVPSTEHTAGLNRTPLPESSRLANVNKAVILTRLCLFTKLFPFASRAHTFCLSEFRIETRADESMVIESIIYDCEYCTRRFDVRAEAVKHERSAHTKRDATTQCLIETTMQDELTTTHMEAFLKEALAAQRALMNGLNGIANDAPSPLNGGASTPDSNEASALPKRSRIDDAVNKLQRKQEEKLSLKPTFDLPPSNAEFFTSFDSNFNGHSSQRQRDSSNKKLSHNYNRTYDMGKFQCLTCNKVVRCHVFRNRKQCHATGEQSAGHLEARERQAHAEASHPAPAL